MNIRKSIDSILEVLGLIGFTVRSDKKKGAWKKLEDRIWGSTTGGFTLSIQARPAQSRVGEQVKIVIALRNDAGREIRDFLPDPLHYFAIQVTDPAGMRLEPSGFGRRVLESSAKPGTQFVFSTTEPVQNELPLSDLYDLNTPGSYHISVSSPVPEIDSQLRCKSNTIEVFRIKN